MLLIKPHLIVGGNVCKMHAWPQALVESLLSEYPNILVLRVRMPIVGDLTYPRNFITKIIKYEKVREMHHCPPHMSQASELYTHCLASCSTPCCSQ